MNNAEGTGQSVLAVYGGLVAEVNPTDLPQGSAPICCDMDFTIGSVKTRDGLESVYVFAGGNETRQAGLGINVTPPSGVAWVNPNNITLNSPGTDATVSLTSMALTSEILQTSNYGFTIPTSAQILGIQIEIDGFRTGGTPIPPTPQLSGTITGVPDVYALIGGIGSFTVSGTATVPTVYTGFVCNGGTPPTELDIPYTANSGDLVVVCCGCAQSGGMSCAGNTTSFNTVVLHGNPSTPNGTGAMFYAANVAGSDTAKIKTTIAPTFMIIGAVLVYPGAGATVSAVGVYSLSSVTTITAGPVTAPSPGFTVEFCFDQGNGISSAALSTGWTSRAQVAVGTAGNPCPGNPGINGGIFLIVADSGIGSGPVGGGNPLEMIDVSFAHHSDAATTNFLVPASQGAMTAGGSTSLFGRTWTAAEVNDPGFGLNIIGDNSGGSQQATEIELSAAKITVWFSGVGCDFDWIGSLEQQDADLLSLALDSCGVFWQEDVNNNPGVLVPFYTAILPNTFAVGVSEDDREFIALSNLQYGTDMPRQYDGTNLDRISQVGPGAPPQVTFASNQYPIVSITQDTIFDHTQIRAVLWSSGPTQTHTPGNVLTFYFQNGTDISKLKVGSGIVLSGFTGVLAGINSTTPYIVTSVGTAPGAGGTFPIITVIAPSVSNVDVTPSAGTIHLTLATLTTSIPVPNLQVGNQINVSGVTPATWDGTWTVLFTPNASQMSISTTSLTGNVATYAFTIVTGTAPTVGQLVTVTGTTNGNGIFNVSGAAITAVSPGTFSVAITSPDIPAAAEAGNAIVNGTIFQFDPGQVIADGTGGFIVVAGGLGAGTRGAVVMFLTRNGYLTAPSPPVIFTLNEAANSLIVSQLPIGPPDTIARVVAFTGAGGATQSGGGGFYYWIPTPVSIIVGGQTVTYNATIVNDNITTTATFNFTDAVLLAAASISFQGSNNFAQIELGPSIGVIAYASRLFAWGTNNKVNNLLNFSFDGGIGQIIPPSGTGNAIQTYPLGWTLSTGGVGGAVVTSPLFGDSYLISNTSGMTQSTWGMITQNAYQDSNMVPIIQSHATYSIRVTASSTSSTGNLVVDLYSPNSGGVVGSFSIPLSSMTQKMQIFTGTLLTNPFTIVPNDLIIRVHGDSMPNNSSVLVDRIEVFPTEQPVLTTEVLGSYFNNFEAFDEVTGVVGVGTQNQQPVRACFSLFDNLYIVKTDSMYVTSDNGVTEPDGWTVREVSNKVGTPSIYGVDYGQGWALIAGQGGLFVFDGGQPVLVDPEIEPLWRKINWKYGNTIWVKNDTKLRKIYIGIPIATPNQWMPNFPINANPTVPNVVLMCQYKELNTSGALEYEGSIRQSYMGELRTYQLGRKWSTWSIEAHFGDFIKRPDTTTPLFLCADDGSGRINTQIEGFHTDNGAAIRSLYCTYPFVKHEEAQGLQLGQHNLRAHYASMNIVGGGNVDITIIPDSLLSPYADLLAPLPLGAPPPWGDTEFPLNDFGARFFVEFSPHSTGDWWELSRLVLDVTKDAWSPVRGGNF